MASCLSSHEPINTPCLSPPLHPLFFLSFSPTLSLFFTCKPHFNPPIKPKKNPRTCNHVLFAFSAPESRENERKKPALHKTYPSVSTYLDNTSDIFRSSQRPKCQATLLDLPSEQNRWVVSVRCALRAAHSLVRSERAFGGADAALLTLVQHVPSSTLPPQASLKCM